MGKKSRVKDLSAALLLRGTALGGRFVFVIFAAKYMLPDDFGRFGLLAGLALLIPVLVALEAYQVFLRRILQEPDRAEDTRRFYAVFILTGSLISAVIGAVTLAAFGWSSAEIGLGAIVLMLEHIGLEMSRNLAIEGLPALSVLSVALRTGAWGLAVTLLYFIGLLPAPWTLETVLWFWIAGGVGAALTGIPILPLFRPRRRDFHLGRGIASLKEVLSRSWTWLIYTAGLRTIETGGRFICAWMISETAAGRFTFISMLASLSYVAQKGVVDQVYYPKMTTLDVTEDVEREFRRMNRLAVLAGTACSVAGIFASVWITGVVPQSGEWIGFILLCLAFASMCLAQPAFYRLYRCHSDRVLMMAAVAAGVAMLFSSVVATRYWGIAGASAGVLVGGLVLLALDIRGANKLARSQGVD